MRISGVVSVLGASNSLTVVGSTILSGNVNLGDESGDAIAITGDATFCYGITMSGDVTLGGASTDTVSDVCTVKSLTVSGDTTLLANVVWARRAPTLSRCGAQVTFGDASAVAVREGFSQWSCHFRALQLRSVMSQLTLSQSTAALLRWQVRSL